MRWILGWDEYTAGGHCEILLDTGGVEMRDASFECGRAGARRNPSPCRELPEVEPFSGDGPDGSERPRMAPGADGRLRERSRHRHASTSR